MADTKPAAATDRAYAPVAVIPLPLRAEVAARVLRAISFEFPHVTVSPNDAGLLVVADITPDDTPATDA